MAHLDDRVMEAAASHRQYTGEYGAHVHSCTQLLIGLKGRPELDAWPPCAGSARSASVPASSN